jgi:uncharacterized membrane protein YdbT with pleckstrin-like domain
MRMSYVEENLAPGEEIVYRSSLPGWNWVGAILLVLLLGWLLGLGIVLVLIMIVRQVTTEIAVTNRRFIYKTGWISRRVHDIHLAKVESSNLQQSFWGRLFGYGKLSVHGTGVGSIDLPNVDNPNDLKRAIEAGTQAAAAGQAG